MLIEKRCKLPIFNYEVRGKASLSDKSYAHCPTRAMLIVRQEGFPSLSDKKLCFIVRALIKPSYGLIPLARTYIQAYFSPKCIEWVRRIIRVGNPIPGCDFQSLQLSFRPREGLNDLRDEKFMFV